MENEWSAIYEQHVYDVYRFLLYFLGSHEDAEDVTQETFLKAFRKWNQFEFRSSPKTWLLSIARNIGIDRLRKKQRTQALLSLLQKEPQGAPELPEEVAQANARKQDLYYAVQALKPDHRAVVILRGLQQQSAADAGLILGWTVNRVNVTFHRALQVLRKKLAETGGEWHEQAQTVQ